MCGIFGVYNFDGKKIDLERFVESNNVLEHRGPDGEGYYWDDTFSLALGHRRLSIIDIDGGNQPMCNEDETVWITFNGEIYNYKKLRNELAGKGHRFKSNCDTEVIIHLYEEYGKECVKKLNGIFAFCLWDKKKRIMFLARDHFGVKPLYYLKDDKRFVFASEIKAILRYLDEKPSIDVKAINQCFTFRHVPSPLTLFSGIKKIPACNTLEVEPSGEIKLNNYWDKKLSINKARSEAEWVESLRAKLEKSVKGQLMSDVPIGISLSGGMDSGALLAIANKYYDKTFFAYTIGFEGIDLKYSEYERARKTAELFQSNFIYQVIKAKDYSGFMDKYLYHLEEPIGNESAAAYYFVAQLAHNDGVKVLINGQGADEPFASYDRYIGMNYYLKHPFAVKSLIGILKKLNFNSRRRTQIEKLQDYIENDDDYSMIASAASITTKEQRSKIFNGELLNVSGEKDYSDYVREVLDDRFEGNVIEKMVFYDMFSSLSDNLLLCEDKMSMAASVEARVPFLDVDFITEALTIPVNLKIKNNTSKYILKKACEKYLSKDIIYQPKIGFDTPMDIWLNTHLKDEFDDLISSADSITNNYLNMNEINKMVKAHSDGVIDNTKFLFLLFSVEKWRNTFFG